MESFFAISCITAKILLLKAAINNWLARRHLESSSESESSYRSWRDCAPELTCKQIEVWNMKKLLVAFSFTLKENAFFCKNMPHCMVWGCKNDSRKTKGTEVSDHHLPRDQKLRKIWISKIGRLYKILEGKTRAVRVKQSFQTSLIVLKLVINNF